MLYIKKIICFSIAQLVSILMELLVCSKLNIRKIKESNKNLNQQKNLSLYHVCMHAGATNQQFQNTSPPSSFPISFHQWPKQKKKKETRNAK